MSTLHGSWINDTDQSYFFIWGETWRSINPQLSENESSNFHPFILNQSEFINFLQSKELLLDINLEEKYKIKIINLPSKVLKKTKVSVPFLSSQLTENDLKIENNELLFLPWQVPGFYLNSAETISLLSKIPLGLSEKDANYLGEDLKFWTHIYRWSLDLLARAKFVPGIINLDEEKSQGQWFPLLDSNIDQKRFSQFSQGMPRVCISYSDNSQFDLSLERQSLESQQLILDCLSNLINTNVTLLFESNSLVNQDLLVQQWLKSLSEPKLDFITSDRKVKRLENALNNWILSIEEYVVTPHNKKLGIKQFRVCFELEPPASNTINSGFVNWKLKYYLQALDNSEYLVDAQTIWNYPVEQLSWKERTIENPQETLLKGLGLASRLYSPIAESLQTSQPCYCELNPIEVYEFIKSSRGILEENGLGVISPPSLAKGQEEKRLGISIEAEINAKKDNHLNLKTLLNYKLKLAVGQQTISQKDFEKLLAQKSPLVEINGEWIALQPADVRAAQTILNESYDPIKLSVEDALRLSTGDTQSIAKLPVVKFEASGVLQELINNLTNNQSIKIIDNPPGFKGQLRTYQKKGVGWLAFLEKWGLGACLADDMGLGKTPQLIAFLLHLKAEDMLTKPTLVVCPTSVLNNWEREVKKFAPTLSTMIHHGDKRKKGKTFVKQVQNKNLVITSYSLVFRDAKTLEQIAWQGVVLDEAQNIKNSQAKQSQAVRKLNADFRIALTGTPVENRLAELWSILDFLNPNFLGTKQFFQRRFATPIEKYGDRESLQILRSLVRPFILRRLKTDHNIIQDLPEKQEMNVFCGLSSEQAELYQKLVDSSLEELEDKEGIQRQGLILSLLIKLKQICNHPAQFLKEKQLDLAQRSGKLLRLEEMLEELIEEGDRALIFTQFSEWGKLLQPYLKAKFSQDVLFLYGATRRQKRQEMIDHFQNSPDGPQIFILSLKAGGTGLNLTRANHVFHIDRWWNPAVENQATDRAFRIGQKRNVQVHKFVCTGTLEDKINEMLESKKQLAEQTVDAGENWLTQLDTDQLRTLLLLDRNAIIDE
ncbi:MAG TPA: ATP-dependent helicase [Cyanothece sp. UBA12306]|nr:ATP-dependent helicase [Cyanothece sp. UBA12306]